MFRQSLLLMRKLYGFSQKTLYASTVVIIATMITARLLGIIKLRILTSFYSSSELDLYLAAFRVPDFIFDVLVAGSISACFIPIIMEMEEEKRHDRVFPFTITLISIFLLVWLAVLFLIIPFRYELFSFLLRGYSIEKVRIVTDISMVLLVGQIPFMLLGNVFGALMQSRKQFLVPGLAPVFYNFGIILGILIFSPHMGLWAAVYGVLIGAFLYMLVVLPSIAFSNIQFPVHIVFDRYLRSFFRSFLPRAFSVITTQIDASVDLFLATLRGPGAYSAFYLAQTLQIIPVSFMGTAMAQTILPFFTDMHVKKNHARIMEQLTRITLLIFFVLVPVVAVFTVLRTPIIRLIYGSHKFDWEATVTTATVFSVFALSIPFHTLYYIVTRVYFALHDTKTPFFVGAVSTVMNSVLSYVFVAVLHYPIWYLALSFSFSITLNTAILYYLLVRRLDHIQFKSIAIRLSGIIAIGIVMGIVMLALRKLLDGLVFDTTRTLHVFWLTSICGAIGAAVYGYLAWIFIPREISDLWNLIQRFSFLKKAMNVYMRLFFVYPVKSPHEEKYD